MLKWIHVKNEGLWITDPDAPNGKRNVLDPEVGPVSHLPPQLLHIPAVLFGGAPGTAVPLGQTELGCNGARGSVIGEAVRCRLGSNALGDQPPYLEDPLPPGFPDTNGVANNHAL